MLKKKEITAQYYYIHHTVIAVCNSSDANLVHDNKMFKNRLLFLGVQIICLLVSRDLYADYKKKASVFSDLKNFLLIKRVDV